MNFKKYPSLARAAEGLQKQGFTGQFILEGELLRHRDTGQLYEPDEMVIVEYHRFLPKGPDRDRVSIIFALETLDGRCGLLVETYHAFGKVRLLEFMDRVKIKSRQSSRPMA